MLRQPGAPMAQRHADDLFLLLHARRDYRRAAGLCRVLHRGRNGDSTSAFTDFSGDGWVKWKLLRLWDGGMAFQRRAGRALRQRWLWVSWRDKLNFIRGDRLCLRRRPDGNAWLGRLANFAQWRAVGGGPATFPGRWCFRARMDVPRHPSQLYQAGLEGLALLVIHDAAVLDKPVRATAPACWWACSRWAWESPASLTNFSVSPTHNWLTLPPGPGYRWANG